MTILATVGAIGGIAAIIGLIVSHRPIYRHSGVSWNWPERMFVIGVVIFLIASIAALVLEGGG